MSDQDARDARDSAPGSFSPATREPVTPGHALPELAALRHELHVTMIPEWDIMGPYTVGGPTPASTNNPYSIINPFATGAEYCVLWVAINGAGSLWASSKNMQNPLAGTATLDRESRSEGIYVTSAGASTFPGVELWAPIAVGGSVWVYPSVGGGNGGYISVAFRRRRDRVGVYYE